MPEKNEIVDRIARKVGVPEIGETVGSSGYRNVLMGVVEHFEIACNRNASKPDLGRAIVEAAGGDWVPGPPDGYDSTLSASGGGSTVTTAGWRAVDRAVDSLRSDARPSGIAAKFTTT